MHVVDIVDSPERKIVGQVLQTSFSGQRQAAEIPPFFQRVMEEGRLDAVPYRANGDHICAFAIDPGTPDFDYCLGVEVEDLDFVPGGMRALTIPPCRCAMTAFVQRGNGDVVKAYHFVTQVWIPANGYMHDQTVPFFVCHDRAFLKIYAEQGYPGNPVAQLWVPVTPA